MIVKENIKLRHKRFKMYKKLKALKEKGRSFWGLKIYLMNVWHLECKISNLNCIINLNEVVFYAKELIKKKEHLQERVEEMKAKQTEK